MFQETGKFLVIIGIIIIIIGLALWWGNKVPWFNWFGNLPGDIKIEKENFKLYFPITTMILLSVVLTIIVWLIRKFH
jgi:hypothetical protein